VAEMNERKRLWKRWVEMFPCGFRMAVRMAREAGLLIVRASKPQLSCYSHLVLYGTASQIVEATTAWTSRVDKNGYRSEVCNRKPLGGLDMDVRIPREEWVENLLSLAEWQDWCASKGE